MSIFDDISRDDMGPRPLEETQFVYLNRSGRAEAARVREKIDGWVNAYPQSVRDQLIARLRSASDDQHTSAVFELFLYHLLQARGCEIISINQSWDTPRRTLIS